MGKKRNRQWRDDAHASVGRSANNADATGADAQPTSVTGAPVVPSGSYSKIEITRSPAFDTYYRAQRIVADDEEFEMFIAALLSPLPITFRINPMSPHAVAIRQSLATEFSEPFAQPDGSLVPPPSALRWYPRSDAYMFGVPRHGLRKSPAFQSFHGWLISLTDAGAISRQEAVSMIPPLLLDVQPHHIVLDMCASPGSKTAQMLEALHSGERYGTLPTGMIVANDNDSSRAYMLVHQCQRINSRFLVVTCHDAEKFPSFLKQRRPHATSAEDGTPTTSAVDAAPATASGTAIAPLTSGFFDRILCDVPCTGDGTARKNADVFRKWSPAGAIGLHSTQLQIAMRGLSLLAVGGLMAYSTCSFSPIENEAVVAEVLLRCNGAVELVDVSDRLPGLVRSPGLLTWRVFDGGMVEHADFVASQQRDASGKFRRPQGKMLPSLFPPTPEVAAKYNLQRCMRLLPHTQDTGGFFIALLRKLAPLPPTALNVRIRPRPPHGLAVQAGTIAQEPTDVPAADDEDETRGTAASDDGDVAADSASGQQQEVTPAPAALEPAAPVVVEAIAAPSVVGAIVPAPTAVVDAVDAVVSVAAEPRNVVVALKAAQGTVDDLYRRVSPTIATLLTTQFGLSAAFPVHLLYTRSPTARSVALAAETIAQLALAVGRPTGMSAAAFAAAYAAAGGGVGGGASLKIVHTGVRIFEANANSLGSRGVPLRQDVVDPESGSTSHPGYRLLQDGATLVLPYLTRQVVYASSAEMLAVLRMKGQVDARTFPKRLHDAMNLPDVSPGSVLLVINPALKDAQTSADTVAVLSRAFTVTHDGAVLAPREIIPAADAAFIPPPLRVHYIEDTGDASMLRFCADMRAWPGDDPLARATACLWKGKNRYSIMATAAESEMIIASIEGRSPRLQQHKQSAAVAGDVAAITPPQSAAASIPSDTVGLSEK